MANKVTFDLTFSEGRELQPPYESSEVSTTGLISSSAEKLNDEGTVWRITRLWDSAENAQAYKAAIDAARVGMVSPPTVSNIVKTEI